METYLTDEQLTKCRCDVWRLLIGHTRQCYERMGELPVRK